MGGWGCKVAGAQTGLAQPRVLGGSAARFVDGVLLRVEIDLRVRDLIKINPAEVRQSKQVEVDVRELLLDPPPEVGVSAELFVDLLIAEPLQLGKQLAHLSGEGHGHVLRSMELLPVTLPGEGAQSLLQELVRGAHDSHASPRDDTRSLTRGGPNVGDLGYVGSD